MRHMVVDISCLDKSSDLRLMLYTKGVLTLTVSCFVTVAVISRILHYFTKIGHVHPHIFSYQYVELYTRAFMHLNPYLEKKKRDIIFNCLTYVCVYVTSGR